jgi:uncharacterized damage-inducible protein DinB
MRRHPAVPRLAVGLTAVFALTLPAAAQQHHDVAMPTSGIRAELIGDIGQVEQRYLQLADAMKGKYEWRPGEGVRSVSEVFMHIAGANFVIPMIAGVKPPEFIKAATVQEAMGEMQALEKTTDEAKIRDMLQHSFTHAKHAIAMTPEAQLEDMVKLFGQDATKRRVLTLLVAHMHEHLGQQIAYARTNGVVPPWSAGGM